MLSFNILVSESQSTAVSNHGELYPSSINPVNLLVSCKRLSRDEVEQKGAGCQTLRISKCDLCNIWQKLQWGFHYTDSAPTARTHPLGMADAFSTGQLQWRKLKTEFPFIWIQESVIIACLYTGKKKKKILSTRMLGKFYSSPASGRKIKIFNWSNTHHFPSPTMKQMVNFQLVIT